MSIETDMLAVIAAQCPRVVFGMAPFGTAKPYVTLQHIGGDPLDFLDNTAADKRNAQIQINTWADTALQAFTLIQSIEAALRAALDKFVARPLSEPIQGFDDADIAEGYLQTFSVTGKR